jgi:hypothetical protein
MSRRRRWLARLLIAADRQMLEWIALGATATVVTPDDGDVRWLARHAETSVVAAGDAGGGRRWQDAGWWLVFPGAALALLWFRPGWVVDVSGTRRDAADGRWRSIGYSSR